MSSTESAEPAPTANTSLLDEIRARKDRARAAAAGTAAGGGDNVDANNAHNHGESNLSTFHVCAKSDCFFVFICFTLVRSPFGLFFCCAGGDSASVPQSGAKADGKNLL